MNKSDTIQNLAAALSKAQAEMPSAKYDSVNPFLKNGYASLGSIIDAAQPILARHGLSVSQLVTGDERAIGIETVLLHESGEWMSATAAMALDPEKGKSSAQVAGSIISYLRRYALAAVLGMYAEQDNDAQAAPAPQPRKPATTEKQATPVVIPAAQPRGAKFINVDNWTAWNAGCSKLAAAYPAFALDNGVNMPKIIASAARLGFQEVTDANFAKVIETINSRCAAAAAAEQVARETGATVEKAK